MASGSFPETSLAPSHSLPTKVSSISTTHENKGVSITRSHEVPGKSSTDGTSSTAGKSGSLSLDALAKAKKALQMQKELAEKLKKIPVVSCYDKFQFPFTVLKSFLSFTSCCFLVTPCFKYNFSIMGFLV